MDIAIQDIGKTERGLTGMEDKIKICKYCGKEFKANREKQKYCCTACRRQDQKRTKKSSTKKDAKERMEQGLIKDAMEAKKRGMTYGQYKGWQYCERQIRERGQKK